jgi:serine/threonine-protein kinase
MEPVPNLQPDNGQAKRISSPGERAIQVVAGRYQLLRKLATGGMGEVFLATQNGPEGFEKVVALKRMLPQLIAKLGSQQIFLDEARLAAHLTHRNICQILDLGVDDEGFFVVMEFVNGHSVLSLLERLQELRETLPAYHAIDVAAQVADALAYAYSARGLDGKPLHIIHRDVSPHNVLLSVTGDVKLIDFGIAKSTQQQQVTEHGIVKGKLAYLSPEQSRRDTLDNRSDLFSLGIVLYEMVSGRHPFEREDLTSVVHAIRSEPVVPLAELNPAWAALDPVVSRLLAKRPEERYADAHEAAEALMAVRNEMPYPKQRLGRFIAERFKAELKALTEAITNSRVRQVLGQALYSQTPTPGTGAPVPSNTPASGLEPTVVSAPAPQPAVVPQSESVPAPAPAPAPVALKKVSVVLPAMSAMSAMSAHGDSLELSIESFRRLVKPGPTRAFWMLLGVLVSLTSVITLWLILTATRPAQVTPAMPLPLDPIPTLPPPPAPAPAVKPLVVVAPEMHVQPPQPVEKAHVDAHKVVHPAKHAHVPAASTHPAAPAPEPETVLGVLHISGTPGTKRIPITQESGRVSLPAVGDFDVTLDYAFEGGRLAAHLSTQPWAIVYVNGVSKGKSPATLVTNEVGPLQVELHRPGSEPVVLMLSTSGH